MPTVQPSLVLPLILGTDLLGKHKIVVDFSEHLVKGEKIGAVPMTSRSISWQGLSCPACEVHKTEWRTAERYCAVAIHEELEAGHQGFDKTLARVQDEAYWVGMTRDVNHHCTTCEKCQAAKLNSAKKGSNAECASGTPITVDILEVPLSIQGNHYILVIHDYFTKWLEAIALKDQTADTITKELIVVFGRFGMPQFLHSDQGRNFESTLLRSTLEAFGVEKTRTTSTRRRNGGEGKQIHLTDASHIYREENCLGKVASIDALMHIAPQSILQQAGLHSR